MPSLAITGTLGSGKSMLLGKLCAHLIRNGFPVASYSADEENRRLLLEDKDVQGEIECVFGKGFIDAAGVPDRKKLRELITRDPRSREMLEAIMHPRLERVWCPLAEKRRLDKSAFFVAEIPLLYEKGLTAHFGIIVVIACSDRIRRSRLASHRSVSEEETTKWLAIQESQNRKINLADHVFWNDGHAGSIELQISQLLSYLPCQ